MRYIRNKEIDKSKWDLLVSESTEPRVYMSSWYLDQACQNWDAFVWGDYEAVIPLKVKSLLFFKYVPPPLLVQQTGLIFREGFLIEKALKELSESLLFKSFLRISISFHAGVCKHLGKVFTAGLNQRKNYILNLNKDFEILLSGFNENRKRNIKKATAAKWLVSTTSTFEAAVNMYKQHQALKQQDLKHTYQILDGIYREGVKRNIARLYVCTDADNHPLAYSFFLIFERRIYYLFGSMNDAGRKHSANSLIFLQVIREFAGKDFHLDFEGGNLENIGSYFASLGAQQEIYCSLYRKLI